MASNVQICNYALSHLGVGTTIANLETERSQEAQACRLFFEVCREVVLRDTNWPFATKFRTLALIEEDPTEEWGYSYRLPSDCVKIRRILSGSRNPTQEQRIPFREAQDTSGLLIYTDQENAQLEYTVNETNPSKYPPDFIMAMSMRLAVYIAPRVTGGDPFKMQEKLMRSYRLELAAAAQNAFQEEQTDLPQEAEVIRARE